MRALLILTTALLSLNVCSQCILADYPFNGNADDVSGNNNDGTVNGATLADDRFSTPNAAYDFDGSNDYIDLNTDFDYPERSVNLWFNADNIDATIDWLFSIDHNGLTNPSTVMLVVEQNGQNYIGYATGSGGNNDTNIIVTNGVWNMATIVMTTSFSKYYLNAQLITTAIYNPGSSTTGNATATIGCSRLIDRFFDGKIDDITIYDCELTQAGYRYLCIIQH